MILQYTTQVMVWAVSTLTGTRIPFNCVNVMMDTSDPTARK